MFEFLSAFDPKELVLIGVVAAGGVPFLLQRETGERWFTLGYAMLVLGVLSTNLESIVLPDLFNFLEHAGGLFGSGVAFLLAAVAKRRDLLGDDGSGGRTVTDDATPSDGDRDSSSASPGGDAPVGGD